MKQFNNEQRRVIEAWGGHHLVLAPPGCGKTAVLAERIVWAHEQRGVPFKDMACLTFTNRAARGMRERIYERLPQCEGLDELFVGNVHRFCSKFLFEQGVVPETTAIIDTDMSISIIADYLGEDELKVLGEAKHRQRYSQVINLQHLMYQCQKGYPGKLMVHREALPASVLRELCVTFGLSYSQASTVELYQHAAYYRDQHALLSSEALWMLEALYAAGCYERYKRENDLLDFEDLLLRAYDEMKTDLSPLSTLHSPLKTSSSPLKKYNWIQVDEVQDLNPLQLAIVDLFTDDEATVVYLGDAQQAIFSFMGAQTDTLEMLRKRCQESGGLHNFYMNYRSPGYLLDVFNTYAERQLGIARELLPTTQRQTERQPGDLLLMDSETNIDETNWVARAVHRLYTGHPDESVAVVVAFNSDADEVSAALTAMQVPHFKISGTDLFTTPVVRLLLAHLGVLSMEQNFIAWANILTGMHVFASSSASRHFVRVLMEQGISPVDFMDYDHSTYVAEFVKAWESQDFVVFDTETTGLHVAEDDVVQLAAVRVRQGRVVDELNLFIETDREIPGMLGDVVNPLVDEYARHPHLSHAEALERFAAFAKGCQLLGHNATFDYQILSFQMRRYAPAMSMEQLWPCYYDSLKLARLLRPRLGSYKLKSLIGELGLEGQNSHLANDDIMATLNLASDCYELGRERVGRQLELVARHWRTAEKLRRLYGELYREGRERLYQVPADSSSMPSNPLACFVQESYDWLRKNEVVGEEPKLPYIIRYIEEEMTEGIWDKTSGNIPLRELLDRHVQNLSTMKEADLCGSASMTERVFVSTVHKAKGLEFDNVVVYDAVEGKYPSAYADARGDGEEARKFYVAISRARRRLIITYCRNSLNRWGRWFSKQLSPYMESIRGYF